MSLIRWRPADMPAFPSDILNMQKEMNSVFDNFFQGDLVPDDTYAGARWLPAVDIEEHDDRFLVTMELPGVAKEDVKITMQNNILTVRGEKKQEKETKKSNIHRVERSFGSFQRSFTIPSTVQGDKIEATTHDGILEVVIPKAEEAKPKQIDVKIR